jgi:toxin ParE1/3/4
VAVSSTWQVRLSNAASRDFRDILDWTAQNFGGVQARRYSLSILDTFDELAAGPASIRIRSLDDVMPGLLSIRVARRGRKGRHFVLFHVPDSTHKTIEVLRVLHDAMDIGQHLSSAENHMDDDL